MVHTKVVIIVALAVIAIFFSTILLGKGLINVRVPDSAYGEKLRFLRALTCSYAMCARDGCDSVIIDIGFLDNTNKVSCYSVCNDWEKKGFTGRKCGPGFKLEYIFEDNVLYSADYIVNHSPWTDDGLESDVSRYQQFYWYHKILDGNCFDKDKSFYSCKYDHGVLGEYPEGKCEGVIDKANNPCQRIGGGGSWTDKINTGHLWVGSDINDNNIAKCNDFTTAGYGGLYANCTFYKGKAIYIWTEIDVISNWPFGSDFCPELLLCSS
jgi:hypothetical protein